MDYIPRLADGGLEPSDWISLLSGFGGALVGAIVGGAIAWLLAWQASKATERRDITERNQMIKERCLRLMVKASIMLADIAGIQRSIDESLQAANERGLTNAAQWQRVLPLVGSFIAPPFDADEAAALMALKEHPLALDSIELFQRYDNFLIAVKTYSEKRQGVADLMGDHKDMGSGRLSSALSQEQLSRLTPLSIELESLITQIREAGGELRQLAERVTFGIGPAVRAKLKTTDFPVMELDPAKASPSSS
ncbi:MAG: YtxH domain-containing protein [Devosia sp.]